MNPKIPFLFCCALFVAIYIPVSGQCSRNLTNSDISDFISDGADFSLKLYSKAKELAERKRRSNVFFSPASISLALGMLNVGARGTTRSEILNTLMPTVGDEEIHNVHAWMNSELNSEGKNYELYTGNAVFLEETLNVRQTFLQKLQNCFQSEVQTVDFINQPRSARREINEWVEDQTNNKIMALIPRGGITSGSRMVLANALYFKAEWQRPFTSANDAKTRDAVFYPDYPTSRSRTQKFQLMGMTSTFLYHETNDAQVLGIPYKNGELSMFFFLPSGSLEEFQEKMESGSGLTELMAQTTSRTVEASIPKFKLTAELDLKDALNGLGMGEMFDDADFRGITGDRTLYVSDAFHKAFIEVNEKGTEAAAATAVVSGNRSASPPSFVADHPFLFLIRHESTGAILFMGSVSDAESLE